MTLEKGFWFRQSCDEESMVKAQKLLDKHRIEFKIPVAASLLEPSQPDQFFYLVSVLQTKGLIAESYAQRLIASQGECFRIIFRDTYERMHPNSFLTREDILVITTENAALPIKLSLCHNFIELQTASEYEEAEQILTSHQVFPDQPAPLPLLKRNAGVTDQIRYLSKQEVFYLSQGHNKERPLHNPTPAEI